MSGRRLLLQALAWFGVAALGLGLAARMFHSLLELLEEMDEALT